MVDIFLITSANPTDNPVIRLLENNGVKELDFLCLTHPHYDHVKGVSYLVNNYKIRRFLGFATLTPQEFYNQMVKVLITKAKRLHYHAPEKEIASELLEALGSINNKVKNGQMVHDPVVVTATVLNEVVGQEKLPLRMTAIAPSGRSVARYHEKLSACFDISDPGKILADKVEEIEHNEISSAFILEYGAHRIILGGDVESSGWSDILQRPAPGFDLRADLVKVSHHGSENAYCPGLWEQQLSPQKRAGAVVTAYSAKALPRPRGIAHLRQNCIRVVTTSMSSLKPKQASSTAQSPFSSLPMDARIALDALFKNVSPPSPGRGVCSFAFDGVRTIQEELGGDAGAIL